MLDFNFDLNIRLVFGRNSIEKIGDEMSKVGKKVMVVSSREDFLDKIGIRKKIIEQFQEKNIQYCFFYGVMPNPKVDLVREGIGYARKNKIDSLLAVGGGSAIDTAKAIALGVNYEGDIWDYTNGNPPNTSVLPVGVVLTIPASGSEVSSGAILTNKDLNLKRGMGHPDIVPKFAIMNPEFTYTLPKYQSACGIVDILCHVMERYFTNTKEVDFIDSMSEGIMKSIIRNGLLVMDNPKSYDARSQLMLAGSIAHNGLLGVGRNRDWSSHYIEHEVSAFYDIAHGAGLAIITPQWMRYVYKYDVDRFAKFAVSVFEIEEMEDKEALALKGIEALETFFRKLEMPKTLTEMGIDNEHFETIAKNTLISRPGVGAILKMNEEHITNILNMCL